jgi:selenocysteine-specific elongation factor
MRVIGTAGHVDHGKSALVEALTGTHPDRLLEEQRRQMTIDLGFAWMTLPGGEEVGIVDVPGHRDFIDNMLAGVGGLDAVLLVVAGDEGVMPQTREHLQIIDLLGIERGIVALTKTDLVEAEWLALVEADVRRALAGTTLEGCPILRVSSIRREGLEGLCSSLANVLGQAPVRADLGRARLSVDRVFHMAGFGTVVTGTLLDGSLRVGEDVVILPTGIAARVRGLQSHKTQVTSTVPGSRTAVNLGGVRLSDVRRGDVVARPETYTATRTMDVQLKLVGGVETPLRDREAVKVYLAAARVAGRARRLEREPARQGLAWVRLELDEPLIAVRGDRLIVRRPSPAETLGGGVVVDPHPDARARRADAALLSRLDGLMRGGPEDVVLQTLAGSGAGRWQDVLAASGLEEEVFSASAGALVARGDVIALGDPDRTLVARQEWERVSGEALKRIEEFHAHSPLRVGMPRNELRSRLGLEPRLMQACLDRWAADGVLEVIGGSVCAAGRRVALNPAQQAAVDSVMRWIAETPFAPPARDAIQARLGGPLFDYLLESGDFVAIGAEVVFTRGAVAEMERRLRDALQARGRLTVADVRDLFISSRKYIVGFLEEMDARGVTLREGDTRRLKT